MLFRKMTRDLWQNKGAYFGCIIIVSLGILIFNMFSIGYDNFYASEMAYYEVYNFAEGFVELEGMPLSKVQDLADIEGIEAVDGRYVKDVKMTERADGKNAYIRLISYESDQSDGLNQFKLLEGFVVDDGYRILLDNKFFDANELALWDEISLLCLGKKVTLEVVGKIQTPEYIYALRTDQEIYPDELLFGIGFIPSDTMDKLIGTSRQVNQLSFLLKEGADYDEVESILKEKLKAYNVKAIYPRKDQKSHLVLNQELDGMAVMSQTIPVMFMFIGGMIMSIILKRMIDMQRQQIGILKAFGYKDRTIVFHYVSYALLIGGLGGLVGGGLGNLLVIPFTNVYQEMFNMPLQKTDFSGTYFVKGMLMVLGFSVVAGIKSAMSTLKLEPSEAMRPPSPKTVNVRSAKRMSFLWRQLNMNSRMAFRNIVRNKGRSISTLMGMIFTIALLGMPWSMKDSMDLMVVDQFEKIQTYDMKITMTQPVAYASAIKEVSGYEGVSVVEGLMEVPVKLMNQGRSKDTVIYGVEESSVLYHIYDKNNNEISVTGAGIVLSERLAEILDADVGDRIFLESDFMRGEAEVKGVTVMDIIPQYLGLNAYMSSSSLSDLLMQQPFITAIMLKGNSSAMASLKSDYNDSEIVFGLDEQSDLMKKYDKMMALFMSMVGMLCIVGIITGFAVIYVSSVINISERKRELASMLVIGMSYRKVLSVVAMEQWILAGVSVVFGVPVMKGMLLGMVLEMNNDIYSMSSSISIAAVLSSVIMTAGSILVAQMVIRRKISRIHLVEALSIKE